MTDPYLLTEWRSPFLVERPILVGRYGPYCDPCPVKEHERVAFKDAFKRHEDVLVLPSLIPVGRISLRDFAILIAENRGREAPGNEADIQLLERVHWRIQSGLKELPEGTRLYRGDRVRFFPTDEATGQPDFDAGVQGVIDTLNPVSEDPSDGYRVKMYRRSRPGGAEDQLMSFSSNDGTVTVIDYAHEFLGRRSDEVPSADNADLDDLSDDEWQRGPQKDVPKP